MASLTSQLISATYNSLLKTSANTSLNSTAQQITDGGGTASPMYLSTTLLGADKFVIKPLDTGSVDRIAINYGTNGTIDPIGVGIGGPNSLGIYGVEIMGTSNLSTDNYFQTIIGYGAYIQAGAVNGVTLVGKGASHKGNNGNGVAIGRDSSTDSFGVVVGSLSQVTGAHNVSVGGRGVNIYGTYNVSIGSFSGIGTTVTTQTQSIAIGGYATVQGTNSVSIGYGTTNANSNTVVLGNTTQSVIIGTNIAPLARLHVRGTGATSSTASVLVQNSSALELFKVSDDGTTKVYGSLVLGTGTTGIVQGGLGIDIVSSFSGGGGYYVNFVDNNYAVRWARFKPTGSVMSDFENNPATVNNSVFFQLNSTTRGFLAPRMTQAQILAIASPASGLQVYNTDIATPCFYDGTAWKKISHSNM